MRKNVSILLMLFMSVLLLTACGKDTKLVGKWNCEEYKIVSYDEVKPLYVNDENFKVYFTFNEDGTGVIEDTNGTSNPFSWKKTRKGYEINGENIEKVDAVNLIDDNTLEIVFPSVDDGENSNSTLNYTLKKL